MFITRMRHRCTLHISVRAAASIDSRVRAISAPSSSFSSSAAPWDCDVAIIGGGIPGALLALQLAQTASLGGAKILLVEGAAPPPLEACLAPGRPIDVRTYAMTPASVRHA